MAEKKNRFSFLNIFRRNKNEEEKEIKENEVENKEEHEELDPEIQEILKNHQEIPEEEVEEEVNEEEETEDEEEEDQVENKEEEIDITVPTVEDSEITEYIPESVSTDVDPNAEISEAKKSTLDPTKKQEKEKVVEEDGEEETEEDVETEATEIGYNKKLLFKLKTATNRTQSLYSELRNYLNKFKDLKFRSNNTGDTYAYKGKVIMKVTVFPKALKVFLALDPNEYDQKTYRFNDMSEVKKYEHIPLRIRVANDKHYKLLLELIMEVAKKFELKKSNVKVYDYQKDFITTSKALLTELGKENLLKEIMTQEDASNINDEVIKKCVLLEVKKNTKGEKKVANISIGELTAAFKSSYIIDIKLLKEIGLVDEDATHLCVTKEGTCHRAITIKADDFEEEALKMIILTGGTAVKVC